MPLSSSSPLMPPVQGKLHSISLGWEGLTPHPAACPAAEEPSRSPQFSVPAFVSHTLQSPPPYQDSPRSTPPACQTSIKKSCVWFPSFRPKVLQPSGLALDGAVLLWEALVMCSMRTLWGLGCTAWHKQQAQPCRKLCSMQGC